MPLESTIDRCPFYGFCCLYVRAWWLVSYTTTSPRLRHAGGRVRRRAPGYIATRLRKLASTKGTISLGITFHGNLPAHLKNKLITFSDADWAGDTGTRKSRSGYTLQLNLGPIEWYSKGQTIQSTSSCMSETIAAVEAAKAIIAARLLLFELGYRQPGSSRLYVDNEATCLNANGSNQSKRSKHFQIRTELLRVYTELGRLHVFKVNTDKNISDMHTKALLNDKFTEMRDIMMGTKADLNLLHYS